MESTEVAIVGAGPIGIEVAWALKRAGVPYVHVEAGQVGSTIQWWAPGTMFFSGAERIAICGVPIPSAYQTKPTREEYLAYLRAVVTQFALEIRTYTRVDRIERDGEGFVLCVRPSSHGVGGPEEAVEAAGVEEVGRVGIGRKPDATVDGGVVRARRMVLAIGDMQRPCLLGIPGEDLAHVSHYFDDPHRYFGRRVLIVGGKNSAVEGALRCWRAGARVTLSYRGAALDPKRVKYWLLPEIEWLISKSKIGWLPGTVPVEIRSGSARVRALDGGAESEVPVDFVLLLTGYQQDPTLFEQLGVDLTGAGRVPRHSHGTMETNVPGVFVAGTASAGTQVGGVKVFIENSHEHAEKIVAAITGRRAEVHEENYGALTES